MGGLLQHCSRVKGHKKNLIENVVTRFRELSVQQLKIGNSVDLGESFGVFSVKM